MAKGTLVTRVDLYSDGFDDYPRYSLTFTDHGAAEDFARRLDADLDMAGLGRVDIRIVPTDDDAIADFWNDLNHEAGI